MLDLESLAWAKMNELLPAIVQDAYDGRVLMQAYMNRDALDATLASGRVTFWSRSRKSLWIKGETSGHHLDLVSIHQDCDGDCLLVLARPHGPACHRGTDSCFDADTPTAPELALLARLEAIIAQRDAKRPEGSYTTGLFKSGVKRIAQKVGEEGVEASLAGAAGDDKELLEESADLVFHMMVLLRARGLGFSEVVGALESRRADQ